MGYQPADGAARLRRFAAPSAKIDESVTPKSGFDKALVDVGVEYAYLSPVVAVGSDECEMFFCRLIAIV